MMFSKFIPLFLYLFPVLATSVAFIGTGVWIRRKNYGPGYDVGGMVAIVLGSLFALWAVVMVMLLVAFTSGTTETITVVEQVIIESPQPTIASRE